MSGRGWGVRLDVFDIIRANDLHYIQVHEFLGEGEWKGNEGVDRGAKQ